VIRDGGASLRAVYASIIGSNIGAFLSPVGALAGVMWMSILKRHDIRSPSLIS
jgi:arsenical pump membrane protein